MPKRPHKHIVNNKLARILKVANESYSPATSSSLLPNGRKRRRSSSQSPMAESESEGSMHAAARRLVAASDLADDAHERAAYDYYYSSSTPDPDEDNFNGQSPLFSKVIKENNIRNIRAVQKYFRKKNLPMDHFASEILDVHVRPAAENYKIQDTRRILAGLGKFDPVPEIYHSGWYVGPLRASEIAVSNYTTDNHAHTVRNEVRRYVARRMPEAAAQLMVRNNAYVSQHPELFTNLEVLIPGAGFIAVNALELPEYKQQYATKLKEYQDVQAFPFKRLFGSLRTQGIPALQSDNLDGNMVDACLLPYLLPASLGSVTVPVSGKRRRLNDP